MYILIAYPDKNKWLKERGMEKLGLVKNLCIGKVETLLASDNTYNLLLVNNNVASVELLDLVSDMSSDTMFNFPDKGVNTFVLESDDSTVDTKVVVELCDSLNKLGRNMATLGLLDLSIKALTTKAERERVSEWLESAVSTLNGQRLVIGTRHKSMSIS